MFTPYKQEDGLHTYRSVKYPVCDKQGRMLALGGISTDITDLTEAYQNLAEKEKLLQNLLEVQEQEKQFICYEFHDGLIQYAVGAAFLLENYRRQFPKDAGSTVIDKIIDGLRKGIADGRRVIRGIRPTVLDDLGLRAAIEDLIDQLSALDMSVAFDFDVGIRRLPKELETTIYRVVQEALNNVRRHSGSNRAKLKVALLDNDLWVEVEDSGCGFDVQSTKGSGFGLLGMTERVRLMGGVCHIVSAKGCGTRISICLPLTDASGNGSTKSQA